MKEPTPVAQFKVYPGQYSNKYGELRGLFFQVSVYKNKKDLRTKGKIENGKLGPKILGAALNYRIWTNGKLNNEIGAILLCKNHLGVGLISHECTHAALSYLIESRKIDKFTDTLRDRAFSVDRKEPDCVDESEEVFCYAVGDLTRQIYEKLYELEILK